MPLQSRPVGQTAKTARAILAAAVLLAQAARPADAERGTHAPYNTPRSLRLAIEDLIETFGSRYPNGHEYLARLDALAGRTGPEAEAQLQALVPEALLASPLLDFDRLLLVRRAGRDLGMPVNHQCNSGLKRTGWDNEVAVLSPVRPDGAITTLFRPDDGGYVGETDLHWDGQRLLFTRSDRESWKIWEIRTDGTGLRQVSKMPADADAFDACYLPSGKVLFASTASYHAVPCWHGRQRACAVYRMRADGTGVRQLCFDQDLDLHPAVLDDGQVVYSRWDYTGPMHMYLRPLMVMNPDGTNQRAAYGSNSYWPNALYFPRPVPGSPGKVVAIVAGYHGQPRMGMLALVDLAKGWREAEGIVQLLPGRGRRIETPIRDVLLDHVWPKFLHPWALSEKYFLVAARLDAKGAWGIYLADVFDNLVLVREQKGAALLEPVPLASRPRPPVLPDRGDLARRDAVVYMADVYAGDGLAGVPRGTVKRLRVVAYDFGYPGLAGPEKVGAGGPWEIMRILGTVPVAPDGSAAFRVPADTPIALQPLDSGGRAVALMRSWYTAMPGEQVSCVGCHERPSEGPDPRPPRVPRPPDEIEPWYGPARGLSFSRDVQPVLDRHCIGCHNGRAGRPDLRGEQPGYAGRPMNPLGLARLHPDHKKSAGGRIRYSPSYDALVPYTRRVEVEDDVNLLVPGEYHADSSPLVQMLAKGHHGVALEPEAWDRLVTWIDLNAPCHGTWTEVFGMPPPQGAHGRRLALRAQYGGPAVDPEVVPPLPPPFAGAPPAKPPTPPADRAPPMVAGWPFDAAEAARRQQALGETARKIDLGGGVTMKLVRIPAGRFVMGDAAGPGDERPAAIATIESPFWMGACEVTGAQFRRFDPAHSSGVYIKRPLNADGHGSPLDSRDQPAVRVSCLQAAAFCRWLSAQGGGGRFRLPTEAEWEWACRAGSAAALNYGDLDADFSSAANVADASLGSRRSATGGLPLKGPDGGTVGNLGFDDGAVVTAPVGRYRPNAWGLHDMHGNAAEWTASPYRPYPYREGTEPGAVQSGIRNPESEMRMVVRGGSFYDPPAHCRSAYRWRYPAWQRVFNVGFRVVAETEEPAGPPLAAGRCE